MGKTEIHVFLKKCSMSPAIDGISDVTNFSVVEEHETNNGINQPQHNNA